MHTRYNTICINSHAVHKTHEPTQNQIHLPQTSDSQDCSKHGMPHLNMCYYDYYDSMPDLGARLVDRVSIHPPYYISILNQYGMVCPATPGLVQYDIPGFYTQTYTSNEIYV